MTTVFSSDSSDDMSVTYPVRKKYLLQTMDLMETASSFIAKMDAPGIQMNDITVHYHFVDNFISTEKQLVVFVYVNRISSQLQKKFLSVAEMEYGQFSGKMAMPLGVDNNVSPTYSITDGVITVTAAKLTIDLPEGSSTYPRTDVYDYPSEHIYTMDLPGLNKEKIKLEIVGRTIRGRTLPELRITGKWERDFNEGVLHRGNRPSHSFCRRYPLHKAHKGIQIENLHWEMENGVLKIVVPKKTRASKRARTIHTSTPTSIPTSTPTSIPTAATIATAIPSPDPNLTSIRTFTPSCIPMSSTFIPTSTLTSITSLIPTCITTPSTIATAIRIRDPNPTSIPTSSTTPTPPAQ